MYYVSNIEKNGTNDKIEVTNSVTGNKFTTTKRELIEDYIFTLGYVIQGVVYRGKSIEKISVLKDVLPMNFEINRFYEIKTKQDKYLPLGSYRVYVYDIDWDVDVIYFVDCEGKNSCVMNQCVEFFEEINNVSDEVKELVGNITKTQYSINRGLAEKKKIEREIKNLLVEQKNYFQDIAKSNITF